MSDPSAASSPNPRSEPERPMSDLRLLYNATLHDCQPPDRVSRWFKHARLIGGTRKGIGLCLELARFARTLSGPR